MTTTVTLSMSTLLIGVPSLVAFSGAVTFVALRGYLNDAVEGHRLLATVDEQSSRWLFLKGYRKTPHAGPDLTDDPQLLALSDRPHADEQADHTDTDRRGMWRVLLGLASDLVDRVHDWLPGLLQQWRERNDVGSGEQATTEDPFAELLAHVEAKPLVLDIADEAELDAQRAEWVEVNEPYTGRRLLDVHADRDLNYLSRHVKPGFETGIFPAINAKVPAQRTGDEA